MKIWKIRKRKEPYHSMCLGIITEGKEIILEFDFTLAFFDENQ